MTLGGSDVTKTPLYDKDFTNSPNTSGSSHYWLMYALIGGTTGTQEHQKSMYQINPGVIPQTLQVFTLVAAPPPPKFQMLKTEVAKVERKGVLPEQIFLDYSQERLAEYGVEPSRLKDVLGARNITRPAGQLEVGPKNILGEVY